MFPRWRYPLTRIDFLLGVISAGLLGPFFSWPALFSIALTVLSGESIQDNLAEPIFLGLLGLAVFLRVGHWLRRTSPRGWYNVVFAHSALLGVCFALVLLAYLPIVVRRSW